MSGTSLDGLDIASCIFNRKGQHWEYRIEAAECIAYTEYWQEQLQEAHRLSGYQLLRLHKEYGVYLAEQVNEFTRANRLQPGLISSHGHTVFHEPGNMLSFQLGDGAVIYALTGIPVVCDLRAVDVAAGGHGAPLVPIGDRLLFAEYEMCLNLGGIANISYEKEGSRIAYDICPCNLILNRIAMEKGAAYDAFGAWAANGRVNAALMDRLNSWPYYSFLPPKSLDKEALLAELMPLFDTEIPVEDRLATATLHIAMQIAKAIHQAYRHSANAKILITGGGAFNNFLVEQLQRMTGVQVVMPDANLVNFKEALVFAFLGLLRIEGQANGLGSVTGAKTDTIGGALWGALL